MADLIPFTGNPLDRASNERHSEEWVSAQLASPAGRYLPFWRLNVLVSDGDSPRLLWLDSGACKQLPAARAPVLLGLLDGAPHFAFDLTGVEEPLAALGVEGARFAEVRGVADALPHDEAGIVAQARSLVDWHARHGFCPNCGQPTTPGEGGANRRCDACKSQHFPRTDPVVIMAVWRDDKILLGRRRAAAWYSTLAGFIDQGETIEAAVKREVLEESGLVVDEVRYHTSQPWPFPSSLMIGCFAHAVSFESQADDIEMDEVRWFTRDEVYRAATSPSPDLGFGIPGPIAIAHHLIKAWAVSGPA